MRGRVLQRGIPFEALGSGVQTQVCCGVEKSDLGGRQACNDGPKTALAPLAIIRKSDYNEGYLHPNRSAPVGGERSIGVQNQIDRFLERITGENYASNTVIAYRGDLAQLLEYLEQRDNTTWKQVTEQDITGYLLHLREREYAPSTVSRKMAAVSSFFRFLVLQGIIFNDPTSHISLPSAERPSPGEALSDEEFERLWTHIAEDHTPRGLRDQVLLGLMAQAGFRPSDLVALNLKDVEALNSRLSAQGYTSLQVALEGYVREGRPDLASSEEEPALFLSMGVGAGGGRLTRQGVWLIVKERARACGLQGRVSPRSLRRLYLARSQK